MKVKLCVEVYTIDTLLHVKFPADLWCESPQNFEVRRNLRCLVAQGRHSAPIKMKFDTEQHTIGPVGKGALVRGSCQKSKIWPFGMCR